MKHRLDESLVKGGDLLIAALENKRVKYIVVPGEANFGVVESLRNSKIKLLRTRHERTASFAAATYGRLTGRGSVCIAASMYGAMRYDTEPTCTLDSDRQRSTSTFSHILSPRLKKLIVGKLDSASILLSVFLSLDIGKSPKIRTLSVTRTRHFRRPDHKCGLPNRWNMRPLSISQRLELIVGKSNASISAIARTDLSWRSRRILCLLPRTSCGVVCDTVSPSAPFCAPRPSCRAAARNASDAQPPGAPRLAKVSNLPQMLKSNLVDGL
ncbi:thiamine pyrophosphate-binding protein (plasmid) [Rhizobium leguminosarum]|nr:thiamine pyrophosphate-binding protein [Rhizobium leguminosarum]WFT91055.1 thiamine pyrophosphate-binding protein [Rhizobium leguminosarum]